MRTGWIQLHRALLDSQVFVNEGLLKVWIYCLLRANHEPCWVPINIGRAVTEIKLNPGQFIYGRKEAGKELRMKPSSVRNRMEKLKNMRNLDIQTDTHYSIVTICNWDSYQSIKNNKGQTKGQSEDSRRTTVGQPEDTENNDKNVKNDKTLYPFEDFWSDYDKKIDRHKCELKWSKISEADRAEIKKSLPDYVRSVSEKRYQKNPLTYLNGKVWKDDFASPKEIEWKTRAPANQKFY